jgi:hypothetical protein
MHRQKIQIRIHPIPKLPDPIHETAFHLPARLIHPSLPTRSEGRVHMKSPPELPHHRLRHLDVSH